MPDHIEAHQLGGDGALLSAACARVRAVLPWSTAGLRRCRIEIFGRYGLLVLLVEWVGAIRADDRATGLRTAVVEVASNDGYLLQHFVITAGAGAGASNRRPTSRAAEAAACRPGWTSWARATGPAIAEFGAADLVLGNNVLAHVPDINDFVRGLRARSWRRGRHHDGVPAPDAADRAQPVRHHLPRALQLPVVLDGGRIFAAHGLVLHDVEGNCRRTAARSASTRATPRMRRCRWASAWPDARARAGAGLSRDRALSRLRRAGPARSSTGCWPT